MTNPDERPARDAETKPGTADVATSSGNPRPQPIDIRSVALTGLFLLMLFHTLRIAESLIFPILFALLTNFSLTPIVRGLSRLRIPVPIGAALVVLSVLGITIGGLMSLAEPAQEWGKRLPASLRKIERKLRVVRDPIAEVIEAADKVEAMAGMGQSSESVEVRESNLAEVIVSQAQSLVTTFATVVVLLYFLLASGNAFVEKVVQNMPRVADKRMASELLQQTESEISRYLLTISAINLGLGTATTLAMYSIGMPNPLLWGVMGAVLNYIPLLGSATNTLILFAVGLVHFDSLGQAAVPALMFAGLSSFEGLVLTPSLLGGSLALSPVAVFTSLLIWSWLWGIPGAIIAVPTLAAIKIFCDNIDSLKVVGAVLGK